MFALFQDPYILDADQYVNRRSPDTTLPQVSQTILLQEGGNTFQKVDHRH